MPPAEAIPNVTGWYLTEAQTALEANGRAVRLVETGPPPRKVRPDKPRKPMRVPIFGAWRVLRCHAVEGDAATLELLVARELLGETRTEPAL
jgi:hypothetical protein